ncbi:Hypothetical predicted protein [Marmota monax]|uniref:Uncharacterized protein n=1 Tax=Marmota monax TaxID=9995 RepID=A0A5E4BXA0_MARMO|nr:Hypothetical predicted protein [Marmota monax]
MYTLNCRGGQRPASGQQDPSTLPQSPGSTRADLKATQKPHPVKDVQAPQRHLESTAAGLLPTTLWALPRILQQTLPTALQRASRPHLQQLSHRSPRCSPMAPRPSSCIQQLTQLHGWPVPTTASAPLPAPGITPNPALSEQSCPCSHVPSQLSAEGPSSLSWPRSRIPSPTKPPGTELSLAPLASARISTSPQS